MFESDDDDDMNLNSSMNAAESDDKEINVMDVSPLKDDVSLKRKSDMAFDLMMSDHSMVTSLTHNEDSNSEFKFKLKVRSNGDLLVGTPYKICYQFNEELQSFFDF